MEGSGDLDDENDRRANPDGEDEVDDDETAGKSHNPLSRSKSKESVCEREEKRS